MTTENIPLLLGVTGATGTHAATILVEKSPWPVALIASRIGKAVYAHEGGAFAELEKAAAATYDNESLFAPVASGSVPTVGMVILPCTTSTLAQIAGGQGDTLITRAAHCHLKERRPLILCVRETPWTAIDFENARRVSEAGGIVMPLSPPFYMETERPPETVTMTDLLTAFVDRVLALLGKPPERTWEDQC